MQKRSLSFTAGFTKNLKVMDGQLSKVSGALSKVGAGIAVAGAAVGGALAWAGQSGLEFEQAISKVGAVSLLSRDKIADLEAKALELGATTKFTATESAQAMEVMARAGFKNGEIIAGVGGIMAAAAAEGADMAEVTSHVSNVLKGMGLQAMEAGRVSDVLALASSRTNSTISTLGESMKNLSPVAKQFGISLEDSVGMVALLQDVGLDASEAGTATSTMLTKLATPSDSIIKKMKEMRVTFQDAHDDMLPPMQIFENMQVASKKLGGNMDVVAFFAELVGLRGQKAALNLQEMFTSEKGRNLTDALKNAAGSAQKMADLSMDNTLGAWTLLTSAIDGVQVALFDLVGKELKAVIDATSKWVGANKELIVSDTKQFIIDLRDALPTIVTWIERIGKVLVVFALFAAAVKIAAVAMAIFNAVMLLNPISLLIYLIIAWIALIWAFWPEISAFFKDLWKGITDVAGKIWKSITGIVESAIGAYKAFFSAIWGYMGPFFTGLLEYVVGLFMILVWPIKSFAEKWIAIFSLAIDALMIVVTPIAEFFTGLWAGIAAGASAAWEAISYAAGELSAGISAVVSDAFSALKEIWAPVASFFAGLWEGIASGFKSAMGWVLEKMEFLMAGAAFIADKIRGVGRDAMGGDPVAMGAGVTSPAERIAGSFSETHSKTSAEVTLIDKTGKASVTKQPSGPGMSLNLQQTGGYY